MLKLKTPWRDGSTHQGTPPLEFMQRLSWAKLLQRVFDLELVHCPNCGGKMKIIAAILDQPVIEKILTHLCLQARAPPRAPARGPQLQAA